MTPFRWRSAFVVLTTTIVIMFHGGCGALHDEATPSQPPENQKGARPVALRTTGDTTPAYSLKTHLGFPQEDAATEASGTDGRKPIGLATAGRRRALRFSGDNDSQNDGYDRRKPQLSVTGEVNRSSPPEDEGPQRQARAEAQAESQAVDGGGGHAGEQPPPTRLGTPLLPESLPFTEDHGAATTVVKTSVLATLDSLAQTDSIAPDGARLCSRLDWAGFEKGRACGSPLGAPCFDKSLCRRENVGGESPKIYVYDNEVSPNTNGKKTANGQKTAAGTQTLRCF